MTNKRGWHAPTITLPRIRSESRQERKDDPVLTHYFVIAPVLLLSVLGLIMGFSAQVVTVITQGENPYTAYAHPLIIVLVSLVAATTVLLVPQRRLMYLVPVMFVSALGFRFLAPSPLGHSEGGNTSWVKVDPIMTQPSEFLKPALIVFLVFIVLGSASRRGGWKVMNLAVDLSVLTASGAVMLGRGMGTAMVVAVSTLGAMRVVGLPERWFGDLAMLAIPTMVLLVLSSPTRVRRILAIFSGTPKGPDESTPEQIDHSLWALGSGGLTDLGPGTSHEKWNYLQAMRTNLIFAIVGGESGLLDTLGVLLCLGLLVWGMFRVTHESSDPFVTIASSGMTSWISIQTVINVLSMTGLGPVIGVPLPLVSYGGSSFLFTIIVIAAVASFARARAGIQMIGRPDEVSAGCDSCPVPHRRSVR